LPEVLAGRLGDGRIPSSLSEAFGASQVTPFDGEVSAEYSIPLFDEGMSRGDDGPVIDTGSGIPEVEAVYQEW